MKKNRPLAYGELSYICEQLAVLLKSGVNSGEALSILSAGSGIGALAPMASAVLAGSTFSDAAAAAGAFPDYFISLTRVGEQSGRLDETLDSLHGYFDRMDALRRSVKSAVRYPAIMTAVMLAVLGVILTKAMPIFANVYEQLGETMSGAMQVMYSVGMWLSVYWYIPIGIIAAIVLFFVVFGRFPAGKRFSAWLYENSFVTRRISRFDTAAKLTYALSLCVSSGFTMEDALDMAKSLVPAASAAKKIARAKEILSTGGSASAALGESGILQRKYSAMIEVGERSGSLEHFLRRVCVLSEREADQSADRAVSSIEPTVVIIMAGLVGLLLVSAMLPLLRIMAGL